MLIGRGHLGTINPGLIFAKVKKGKHDRGIGTFSIVVFTVGVASCRGCTRTVVPVFFRGFFGWGQGVVMLVAYGGPLLSSIMLPSPKIQERRQKYYIFTALY